MEVLQTTNNALESNEVELTALRARCERLEVALQDIIAEHDAHCEHYYNVSQHSYNLVNIAKQALEVPRG